MVWHRYNLVCGLCICLVEVIILLCVVVKDQVDKLMKELLEHARVNWCPPVVQEKENYSTQLWLSAIAVGLATAWWIRRKLGAQLDVLIQRQALNEHMSKMQFHLLSKLRKDVHRMKKTSHMRHKLAFRPHKWVNKCKVDAPSST
ncbi:hypothetical protein AWZ03_014646 [Drosophila navojoa]|uniref:Transmembrane protein n=1 Tax=Drosophila navojoa TaxID=7232 RepID=A0A484AS78_DRONA|nr:hypothetical protein AWZ03_014646 [Drosophila navojoa]